MGITSRTEVMVGFEKEYFLANQKGRLVTVSGYSDCRENLWVV